MVRLLAGSNPVLTGRKLSHVDRNMKAKGIYFAETEKRNDEIIWDCFSNSVEIFQLSCQQFNLTTIRSLNRRIFLIVIMSKRAPLEDDQYLYMIR